MRLPAFIPVAALILSGFAPAPLPAVSPPQGEIDADSICSRFMDERAFEPIYGARQLHSVAPAISTAPPPPPPPPPLPPPPSGGEAITVAGARAVAPGIHPRPENRERYAGEEVAQVQPVAEMPVSTFGVDVDTGSYANVRRMLTDSSLPPQAAVRTEEMLNYFRYDYPDPRDRTRPFTISADMSRTPWNADTRLLRIGLNGYDVPRAERPAANLVFLVDVSGSMMSMDKLPLVKCSLALLAERLSPRDRVSVVVYAGASGRVLDATSDKGRVLDVLDRLRAGGSTAGAEGIALAYRTARDNWIQDGINRVILATDGDFNVGVTDTQALIDMVEREREAGITLTTLGYGTGNFNEAMMEQIADHGNGNYAYIDSPREAEKVLGEELSSTLFTIAEDVKIQVEFNPAYVSEYRLIGYENRALSEQDFANDAVDAGDIGAGHQVTALYEIVPVGSGGWLPDRRYPANRREAAGSANGELAHLRLRYKLPGEEQSRLIEQPVRAAMIDAARAPDGDMAFAAAVAAYGQLLRGDPYLKDFGFGDARRLAERGGTGGYWRNEFVRLTELAQRELPDGREGGAR